MREHVENPQRPKSEDLTRMQRTARGAPRRGLLGGVAVMVLAVGLVAGIWDISTPNSAAAQTAFHRTYAAGPTALTKGFDVRNYSQVTFKYEGYKSIYDGGELEGGGPAKGTLLPPRSTMHFEQVYKWGKNSRVSMRFTTTDQTGSVLTRPTTWDIDTEVDTAGPFGEASFWIPKSIDKSGNTASGVYLVFSDTTFTFWGSQSS